MPKSLVTGGQNAARTGTKPSEHKICGRCELTTVVRQRYNATCAYRYRNLKYENTNIDNINKVLVREKIQHDRDLRIPSPSVGCQMPKL